MSKESYKKWYDANKDKARERKREAMRRYRKESPEKYRAQTKAAKQKLRERLFSLYGHSCSLCGFENKLALTLDHVKNNGNAERRLLGERGVWVKAANNYLPEDYRTLCMNCQFIERAGHQKENST